MSISNNRTLGLGFGPGFEFNLFIDEEIYKPVINKVDGSGNLVKQMPDILVDLDITRLMKIMPVVMSQLSASTKQLFANETILQKIDRRFLETLKMSLPEGQKPTSIAGWSELLLKDNMAKESSALLAYLVPAILDRMSEQDLVKASEEIAKGLAPKDFKAITVPKYFDIQFMDVPQKLTLKNNGRSLVFKPTGESKSTAIFRDKVWELDHTHVHLERDNEEREYRFYQTREQYEQTKGTPSDPNLEIVGEVHSVFKRKCKNKESEVKFMAVGIPLKLGAVNPDFQQILDQVHKVEQIMEGVEVSTAIIFRNVFMKGFSSEDIIYHSWGSLKSTTHAFRAGLRFNISKKPIIISTEQYNFLKALFGNLEALDPEKVLYPIDRKADYRKSK